MSKIINFARQQVGEPYVFGSAGYNSWDCSGLTKTAVKQIGLIYFHGASTQWHRGCGVVDSAAKGHPEWVGYFSDWGTIDTLPMNRVCQLFNRDRKKEKVVMAHTGLYDGKGNVIQAGGQYRGVSDKPLNKSRWSHWGMLKPELMERDESMDLRKGQDGAEVKELQGNLIKLKYEPGPVDGKFGAKTEAAVRAFQKDNSLPTDGIWDNECQERMNERLGIIHEPIDNTALLNEIESISARLIVIARALREVP